MAGPRIVIVGGGFSGLVCARELGHLMPNAELAVLEASPVFGGRVQSASFGGRGRYNAGAAEIYSVPGDDAFKTTLGELGLTTRPMEARPIFGWQGRLLRSESDLGDLLGRERMDRLDRFWQLGASLRPVERYVQAGSVEDNAHPWERKSFADVLADDLGDEKSIEWIRMRGHSDLAAEPDTTTGLFGLDNLLIDDPRYCRMYLIEGTNEELTKRLVETSPADLVAGAPVRRIEPSARGFRVVTPAGERDADVVIVALQPPAFPRIAWGEPLDAASRAHARHHNHWTGYLRVTFLCKSRYWRRELPEDYFVCDCLGGVTAYDQSWLDDEGHGVLSVLAAGEPTRLAARKPDGELARAVMAALPEPVRSGADQVLDARVDRFEGASGVSRLPGGWPLQSYEARHTPYPGFYFTGDYLYDATLNGAHRSALWVCRSIARRFGVSVAETGLVRPRAALGRPR